MVRASWRMACFASVLGASVSSCGARSELDAAFDVGATVDDGGQQPDDDATTPATTHFSASQVQAALASCGAPHGPTAASASQNQSAMLATGAWLVCQTLPSPADGGVTVFSPGITFSAGGTAYRLVPDGSGGLVQDVGVLGQGTWSVACEDESPYPLDQACPGARVDIHVATQGGDLDLFNCAGGPVTFEDSPRRMYVVDEVGEWCYSPMLRIYDIWLVPLL
jgi:hypothetical protein